MSTKIEWTDVTWNPVSGCSKISAGCKNCYAERMAKRLQHIGTPGYDNGFAVTLHHDKLEQPYHWRKPKRIFVCSMSDLFHDDVPDEFIDKVFAVMALAPQHDFQCLTKRADRMMAYFQSNPVERIVAYLYDSMYEQRANPIIKQAIQDRFGRVYLEGRKASRHGSHGGWRLPHGSQDKSMQASESRVQAETGLLVGDSNDRGEKNCNRRSSSGLDSLQHRDTEWPYDQSQGRREGQQPPIESGTGNHVRAAETRSGSAECESPSSTRQQASKNEDCGTGCDRHAEHAGTRNDGEGYSIAISYEEEGGFSNLHKKDLEAHLVWPLPNVWLGVSVENQEQAEQRIPLLLDTPASVRFLSCEPLLEHVDLTENMRWLAQFPSEPNIHWVIVGGESGPNARPMNIGWARSLRDQCEATGTPFFFKQWGGKKKKQTCNLLDGREHHEFPDTKEGSDE